MPRCAVPKEEREILYPLRSRGHGGGERVCCLLVLNLVSSTLPCIPRARPRLDLFVPTRSHTDLIILLATSMSSCVFLSHVMSAVPNTSPPLINSTLLSAFRFWFLMTSANILSSFLLSVNIWTGSWFLTPHWSSFRVSHWCISLAESMLSFSFLGT